MNVYSIWPYFALTAILLVLASSSLLSKADTPPSSHGLRVAAFDGLRGLLSLAVFFHHGATYHEYLADGLWLIPESERFYLLLGKFGVAGFFMITGYLFWSRIISEQGHLDWRQFYIGRVFRIGPLYLVAAAFMLIFVLVHNGIHMEVSPFKLFRQVTRWISLGLLKGYEINGSDEPSLLLGVAWSLQFEWYFYLSLPILALMIRRNNAYFGYCSGALIVTLIYIASTTSASLFYSGLTYAEPVALFLAGMICASSRRKNVIGWISEPVSSFLVCVLVIVAFTGTDVIHSAGEIISLGAAFFLITQGCSVFGLLTSRAARRLGNVSYGIYLFQLLLFAGVFSFGPARGVALWCPFGHWLMMLFCGGLLVVFAAAAHVWIERPGIEFGKYLTMRHRREIRL